MCNDSFLCILNIQVKYQFRMLQYKVSNLWKTIAEQNDKMDYSEKFYTALKECIRKHQSLIKFCDKLECLYTLPILGHVVIFSLLMCIDAYELFLVRSNVRLLFTYSGIQFTVKLYLHRTPFILETNFQLNEILISSCE